MTDLIETETRVVLPLNNNQGYDADQINTDTTLGELHHALTTALNDHGPDVIVVTRDEAQEYGAKWGQVVLEWGTLETVEVDADSDYR